LFVFSDAAFSAAAPAASDVAGRCDAAKVSGTVTSQVRHLPLIYYYYLIIIIFLIALGYSVLEFRKRLYVAYVNLKAAFNSIDQNALFDPG